MQSRLYALRNVICPSRPSQWSRHTFKSFATKSAYKDEGTQKVIQDIRKLEQQLEATKKMEQAHFEKLDPADIEAIYNDLAAKVPAMQQQPKIGADYLEKLRVKFLDTRPLRQLPSSLEALEAPVQMTPENTTPSNAQMSTSSTDSVPVSVETTQEKTTLQDVTVFDFEKLIYANALANRPEQAEQALQLMKDLQHIPTVRCYNHLMDAYANTGNVEQVVDVFKRIGDADLSPDVYSYSSLVKGLVHTSRLDDAFVVFDQMKKANILPTQPIFGSLISGCLKSRQLEKAWKTFDEMRLSYYQPDEVTFTTMLHACARNGEVERALNLFEDMSGRQLYPTDITFNVLIHACAKRPDYYDEAFSLLHQMEDIHGFQPDLVTYNTLLGACARKKDLENARNIFRNILQADHMHPDRWSFANLFWCYANYDPPTKNKKERAESPIAPSTSSLIADTSDLILPKDLPTRRSAIVDEAMSVFEYMTGQQHSPIEMTTSLLTAYLNAHVTQYPTQHCTTIYDTLFSNHGISPDAYTFKTMLRYCYQTKDTDLAWRIWDDYQAFLEARALPLTYSDMTVIEQKKAKLEQQEQQVKEGWTQAHQRLLVITMASVLARANDLRYAVQLLNNSFNKGSEFKPLRLKEVMTVYNKAIQLEDKDMVHEVKQLCALGSKKSVPGSTKYRRVNSSV